MTIVERVETCTLTSNDISSDPGVYSKVEKEDEKKCEKAVQGRFTAAESKNIRFLPKQNDSSADERPTVQDKFD